MATASNRLCHTVGKRKSAIARVTLKQAKGGAGKIVINDRSFEDYFPREVLRRVILQPLEITNTVGQYDIFVMINGGGSTGQAGALRHSISRSLNLVDPTFRAPLKAAGLLTRDSREVERKKYGRAGARRRFQFSKR